LGQQIPVEVPTDAAGGVGEAVFFVELELPVAE